MYDLTNAYDHPARVLEDVATKRLSSGEIKLPTVAVVAVAITDLREYEAENDVTFAALDNETLLEVRRAYRALDGDTTMKSTNEFEAAVAALLGLDD